jgi:hypothetical protein
MKKVFIIIFLCLCMTPLFGGESVVCIHGFMVTPRSMRMVSRFLQCGGADTYVWGYPSRKRILQEHGCHLVCFLQQLAAQNPGKPINFVAHSTGGLVLRAALNLPGCPEEAKIGRVVLLAPPNKGAVLARRFHEFYPARLVLGTKSGRQLMCYCPKDIARLGEFPECLDILVVAGYRGSKIFFNEPNDRFVTLKETMLDRPHKRMELNISHDQMLSSRAVLHIVNNFILCGYNDRSYECD